MAVVAAMSYPQHWLPSAGDTLSAVWRGPTGLPRTGAMLASVALIAALIWSVIAFNHSDRLLHVHYWTLARGTPPG